MVDLCTHPILIPSLRDAYLTCANSVHTATKMQDDQEIPNIKRTPSIPANGEMSWDTPKLETGECPAAAPGLDVDEQDCGLQPSEAESRKRIAHAGITVAKEQRGWRRVIRNFTPS